MFCFKSLLNLRKESAEGLLSICLLNLPKRSSLKSFAEGLLSSLNSFLKVYYRNVKHSEWNSTLDLVPIFFSMIHHLHWKMCATPGASHCIKPGSFARRPLCHKVNLPRCEAWRRQLITTCTRKTNIKKKKQFKSNSLCSGDQPKKCSLGSLKEKVTPKSVFFLSSPIKKFILS